MYILKYMKMNLLRTKPVKTPKPKLPSTLILTGMTDQTRQHKTSILDLEKNPRSSAENRELFLANIVSSKSFLVHLL